ncbi:hypothetical protein HDV05_000616 [Chytridiales sp. JEL 0842]|nr:hypothetical protein HDV05_000616 [Chytridiales sp. JEL 0842]
MPSSSAPTATTPPARAERHGSASTLTPPDTPPPPFLTSLPPKHIHYNPPPLLIPHTLPYGRQHIPRRPVRSQGRSCWPRGDRVLWSKLTITLTILVSIIMIILESYTISLSRTTHTFLTQSTLPRNPTVYTTYNITRLSQTTFQPVLQECLTLRSTNETFCSPTLGQVEESWKANLVFRISVLSAVLMGAWLNWDAVLKRNVFRVVAGWVFQVGVVGGVVFWQMQETRGAFKYLQMSTVEVVGSYLTLAQQTGLENVERWISGVAGTWAACLLFLGWMMYKKEFGREGVYGIAKGDRALARALTFQQTHLSILPPTLFLLTTFSISILAIAQTSHLPSLLLPSLSIPICLTSTLFAFSSLKTESKRLMLAHIFLNLLLGVYIIYSLGTLGESERALRGPLVYWGVTAVLTVVGGVGVGGLGVKCGFGRGLKEVLEGRRRRVGSEEVGVETRKEEGGVLDV